MDPFVAKDRAEEEVDEDEEEEDDGMTRGLTFNEVLHLLTRKAVLGPGIPEAYSEPPWRVPSSLVQQNEVNQLLEQSMCAQAATVPGSDDFCDFVLSNSSLAVASLLRHYLSVLGINSRIVFGVLLWDESARESASDYEGAPHVWLEVAGFPVDNVHVSFPASADAQEHFWDCKQLGSYCAEDPLQSNKKLFLGLEEQAEDREVVKHNLKMLQTFSQPQHTFKYLAVSMHWAELNPGVRLYHLIMAQWIRANWGKTCPNIEAEASRACWACRQETSEGLELKTCTECKVARYCNRDCQRREWRVHKLLHRELGTTKELLARNAREEGEEG